MKNNLEFTSRFSLLFLLIVIVTMSGCARMGNPDGGWYDEEPPYVMATSPMENAVNFDGNKIYLLFNEYVQLENAQEKVVVSPPQLEQPEIKVMGNKIRVELKDSLLSGQTYTIDFSDAISDNNEGNPMGNYTFTFSTGDYIDTMEVSGNLVEAETLEPIKGMLVGLYEKSSFTTDTCDTVFRTQPMLRVSRSDASGRFNIKGVARDKEYRVFALEDNDGDYKFSQKSERLAFSDQIIKPNCYPDQRPDTLWRDALHIKDLVFTPYTHFTPDDIVLRVFQEEQTDRHLIKKERKSAEQLSVYFTYGHKDLPQFKPLTFSAEENKEYLVEHSLKNDTITYWLSDSTLINQDSLIVELTYMETDTLGNLCQKVDTLDFIPKLSYERRMKLQDEEYKKWAKEQEKLKKKDKPYETEMPKKPLEVKWNVNSVMTPKQRITFTSPAPIALIDTSKIYFSEKVDTLWESRPFVIEKDTAINRLYYLVAEFSPKSEYKLEVDSFAIRDIYDRMSKSYKASFKVGDEESYGNLIVDLSGVEGKQYIFQLLSGSDKVTQQIISKEKSVTFKYLKGGNYYLKLIVDDDEDGKFTTGLYEKNRQPEAVYFYHEKIEIKEKWDKNLSWNPTNIAIPKQKPAAIVKQKADKKKTVRTGRNLQRARDLGYKFLPDGTPVQ